MHPIMRRGCLDSKRAKLLQYAERVWDLRSGSEEERIDGAIKEDPLTRKVAAVSCGIFQGNPVLDLDYDEDSAADADANFVLIEGGQIAEVQATAEGATYDEEALLRLLRLARIGCDRIFAAQDEAVK